MPLSYTGQLVVTTCWCGIRHAVPEELYDLVHRQHEDGRAQRSIYCPLGHPWTFAGESRTAQLERELASTRRSRAAAHDLLRAEERSHAATRGHLTRAKRRTAAGVCPCCHRTVKQLADHMATKHPEYVGEVLG